MHDRHAAGLARRSLLLGGKLKLNGHASININSIDNRQYMTRSGYFPAMSQENVDAFRRGMEAISRGDLLDIPETIHPEAVMEPLRSGTEGPFVGHDGMRRFITDTEEMFELFRVSLTDVRDLGDRVLAIGSIRMRGRESGVETDVPTAAVAEYRDGLLWRYKDYGNAREALRAAGLE